MSTTQQLEKLRTADIWAKQHPTVKLLVLFGSRARGDHDRGSEWDIAFLSAPDSKNPSA